MSSSHTRVSIGVDGGGTKTNFTCIDSKSHVVLSTTSKGSSNQNSVGQAQAKKEIVEGITELLQKANVQSGDVDGICLSMSGVDRPNDKILVKEWVTTALPTIDVDHIGIYNDAVAALASGTGGVLEGIVVISGTGMIVVGFNKGNETRVGGWGPLLGEDGGGYSIGQAVLTAVTQAQDTSGPSTMLHDALLSHLQLQSTQELIPWAYKDSSTPWSRVAAVASVAFRCAEKGDEVALAILHRMASALSVNIVTAARKLAIDAKDSFTLVFAGGNLTHANSKLAHLLEVEVKRSLPHAQVKFPSIEISEAAAKLAANQYASEKKRKIETKIL